VFGLADFKEAFAMTADEIECPVRECKTRVRRRTRNNGVTDAEMTCERCGIVLHSSTFRYREVRDNLLWMTQSGIEKLNQINEFKTESRMSNDNSEDALTWNVFRYLEEATFVNDLFTTLDAGNQCRNGHVIYWSYCSRANSAWEPLLNARVRFENAPANADGSSPQGVSEPDIIIDSDKTIYFIESKFMSGNATSGDADEVLRRMDNARNYRADDGPV